MKKKKEILMGILFILIVFNMIMVGMEKTDAFDNFIYNIIPHVSWLTTFLKFITNFGSTIYIVGFCLLLLLIYKPKKELFSLYGITIISTILNNVIKLLFRRPRPELMGSLVPIFETTFSFPSGHAMATTTFYGFLIYLLWHKKVTKQTKVIGTITLLFLITSVCFSRIYLYIHYPSDVLTGVCISSLLLLLFARLKEKKEGLK